MKTSRSSLVVALVALIIAAGAGADDKSNPSNASQATIVSLLENVNNSVQLGLQINGQFSYPFTFTADPNPTNGITISSTGLISGSPSAGPDQNIVVTVKDSNAKLVATYSIVLRVTNALTVMLGSAAKAPLAGANIIVNPVYAGGDTVGGSVTADASANGPDGAQGGSLAKGSDVSASSAAKSNQAGSRPKKGGKSSTGETSITISCKPAALEETRCDPNSSAILTADTNNTFSYQFNVPLYKSDQVTVSSGSDKPQKVLVQTPPHLLGEEMRAIVGYQQAGASSSDSVQNWFLDFYISRPLAFRRKTEAGKSNKKDVEWRWWGNVRVASFPQQGNQSLADLVTGLPAQIGALKLNQLAQGAEFLNGIEFKPWKSFPFRGFSENTRQVFSLGFIAGFGATGFFSSPSRNVQVFQVPGPGSPQFSAFQKAFPGVTSANVGFIPPDVERFPKQYLAGIRLTTRYVAPNGMPLTSPPAMLAFTVGQNQVVSGGKLRGVIGRVEAFYPLPFGNRGQTKVGGTFSSVYLFGNAEMRLGGARTAPALALNAVNTPASDPSVTLVPLPNTRDQYRIGFGVDLVGVISSLAGGSAKKSTAAASSPKSDNSSAPPASGTNATPAKQ